MTADVDKLPLWQWRATRRLTKTALALAAGVSRNTIMDIENGKHLPKLETMRDIAAVFGVSLDAIDWEAGRLERKVQEKRRTKRHERHASKRLAPVA
jgi:DNA-binding XRE family transcriptional regulator